MSYSLLALLDALAAGALTIRFGRIEGRCGYTDPHARIVVLNPNAPPDQLEEQLVDALRLLTIPEQRRGSDDEHDAPERPLLRLLPGGNLCCDEPYPGCEVGAPGAVGE